jgi:hypothetical protein
MISNSTLISFLLLSISITSFAKTWRINNNNGVTADFNNIQSAHDGAAPGDTLHIEGSPNNYQAGNISKKLIIIGGGYFLDLNPGLQANTQSSKVSWLTLNAGSEGSVIMGLDFDTGYINVFANDIVIKRNKFSRGNNDSNSPLQGVEILQNFGLAINGAWYASTGLVIMNNFLSAGSQFGEDPNTNIIDLNPNTTAIVQNNVFRRGTVKAYNSSVTNNIMYTGFLEGTGNLVSNNIGSKEQFGTADGNKINVNMESVFAGGAVGDAFWKLKSGSPASGAGYGSTTEKPVDSGMYGGISAYVLSGIPPIPAVYLFTNQPVGSSNDPIEVTIKVRSNN